MSLDVQQRDLRGNGRRISFPFPGAVDSEAYGKGAIAGVNSTAIGRSANATGSNSVAVGRNTGALSAEGTAVGSLAQAGIEAVALGAFANAPAIGSVSIGRAANTFGGNNGVSIGHSSSVTANLGVAIGRIATAGNEDVAVGASSSASGSQSTALGRSAVANSDRSVAVGAFASCPIGADHCTAIGVQASTPAANLASIAVGRLAITTAPNQCVIGENVAFGTTFSIHDFVVRGFNGVALDTLRAIDTPPALAGAPTAIGISMVVNRAGVFTSEPILADVAGSGGAGFRQLVIPN